MVRIPQEVAEKIGYYVYALRDPRDARIFYVGKGIGDRINAHGREAGKDATSEKVKVARIRAIEASGRQPDLLFLRTGIADELTAFIVEQAVIDAHIANRHELTNLVKGHHAGPHGLATLDAVIARHRADAAPPIHLPLVMVKINRGWRPEMNDREIFEQTRGHWRLGERVRARAEYVLGVGFGVVRGAYRIDRWFPSQQEGEVRRWGFEGAPAPELAHVVGTHVRSIFSPGSQNPCRVFLDGYPGEPGAEAPPPDGGPSQPR